MFHSLFVNYKVLSSNNQCIYTEYKMYFEKYWKLRKLLKELKLQNQSMKKQVKHLKDQLDSLQYNDEVRIIINCDENNDLELSNDIYLDCTQEQDDDMHNAYELV